MKNADIAKNPLTWMLHKNKMNVTDKGGLTAMNAFTDIQFIHRKRLYF